MEFLNRGERQEAAVLFPRLDNLQIVIVDDYKEVRSAVGGFLSELGAIVHECSNADDAFELVVAFNLSSLFLISLCLAKMGSNCYKKYAL